MLNSVRKTIATIITVITLTLAVAAQTVTVPNPTVVPKGQKLRVATTTLNTEGARVNFNNQVTGEVGEFALEQTNAFGGPYTGSFDAWRENGSTATEVHPTTLTSAFERNRLPKAFKIPNYFGSNNLSVFEMINNGKVRLFQRSDAGIIPGRAYVTTAQTYFDRTIGGGFMPWLMGDQPVPHIIREGMAFANSNIEHELFKFEFVDNNTLKVISVNPMIQLWQNRRKNQPAHYGQELLPGMTVKVWKTIKDGNNNDVLVGLPIFWWFNSESDQQAMKTVFTELERDNHIDGNENLVFVLMSPLVHRYINIDSQDAGRGGPINLTFEVGMGGGRGWAPYALNQIR